MEHIHVELVTPEKLYFSAEAEMVVAPGSEGEFGVMSGHMPFISTLRPGIVTIEQTNAAPLHFFVSGGVAEVGGATCTVLAENVIDIDTMTLLEAQQRHAAARAAYDAAIGDTSRAAAEQELALSEALVTTLNAKS